MDVRQTVPILRSFDASRAGCVLDLSEHHGDGSPGAAVLVRLTGLEQLHEELPRKKDLE